LSGQRANARKILSTHFDDSWWREPILLYVAQLESPLGLIEQIYNDSFKGRHINNVLLAASCLSEVKEDKTNELYRKVFDEVAYMYSCGELQNLKLELLKSDKHNMLLRHMISYLLKANNQQVSGLEILLAIKRNLKVDNEAIGKLIQEYGELDEISNFDLKLAWAIFKHFKKPSAPVISLAFKHSDNNLNEELPIYEHISGKEFVEIAADKSDWSNIVKKVRLFSPYVDMRDEVPESNVNATQTWKNVTIGRMIHNFKLMNDSPDGHGEHVDVVREQDSSTYISSENREALYKIVTLLSKQDYSEAAIIYRHLRGWLDFEDEFSETIVSVYNQSDAVLTKCFCVLLICRSRVLTNKLAEVLVNFVSSNLSYWKDSQLFRPAGVGMNASEALIVSLLQRSLSKLSDYKRCDYVQLLVDCCSSGLSEATDFALSRISGLDSLDPKAIDLCLEILDAEDIQRSWATLLILSRARDEDGSITVRVLPYLYDKEHVFYNRSVSDTAAYSLLKIMSN
ncbi:MAG: hypothetical protein ABW250_03975, partial [Pyrinomonadaceae bacterium]